MERVGCFTDRKGRRRIKWLKGQARARGALAPLQRKLLFSIYSGDTGRGNSRGGGARLDELACGVHAHAEEAKDEAGEAPRSCGGAAAVPEEIVFERKKLPRHLPALCHPGPLARHLPRRARQTRLLATCTNRGPD